MTKSNVKMVKVIYKSTNKARHSVYGTLKLFGGRSFNYGYRKAGDVFMAAEADVVATPARFNSYPCDEPFTVKGGKLENPCGDAELGAKEQVGGQLEDIPGVGPKIAEKLISVGLDTPDKVAKQMTPDLMMELSLPPRSREKIQEWQDSQSS